MRLNILRHEVATQLRRYILVGTSMLLGVVGVVGIAVSNSVATDMLLAREEQLNGREASYQTQVTRSSGFASVETFHAFAQDVATTLGPQANSVLDVSIPASLSASARPTADSAPLMSTWTLGDRNTVFRFPQVDGQPPSDTCYPPRLSGNVALMGSPVVDTASEASFLVFAGHSIRVHLGGTVSDARDTPAVYGTWATLTCLAPDAALAETVVLRVHTGAAVDPSRLTSVLRDAASRHGLRLDDVLQRTDTTPAIRSSVTLTSTLFGCCSALLLVIAVLGIANVGLASVKDRSRELIVRRAFGARKVDVLLQVLSGAATLGLIVGVLSVFVAIGGTYLLVPKLLPTESAIVPPGFPWQACLIGLATAIGTSVIGSIAPAVAATRLPIARALRQ